MGHRDDLHFLHMRLMCTKLDFILCKEWLIHWATCGRLRGHFFPALCSSLIVKDWLQV